MRPIRSNIPTLWTILTSLGFICSCKLGEEKNNNVSIPLGQLVTDSVPFIPEAKVVKYADQSQISFSGLDSIQLGVINIQPSPAQEGRQMERGSQKNKILILKGFKGRKPYVVLDTNNDGSFINEKSFPLDRAEFIRVDNVDYIISDSIYKTSFYFQPFLNTFARENLLVRAIPIERSGIFQSDVGDKYKFALFNHFDREYTAKNSFLAITPVQNAFNADQVKYRIGDTIYLNRKVYLFKNVSKIGNAIEFEHLKDLEKNFGIEVGDYAFEIVSRDILSGKNYQLSNSNKYTLVDFWGTWCTPCIELTGELKTVDAKFSGNEFELVSVAVDDSKEKVEAYLKKNQIDWINIYDDSKNSVISSKFKVQAYPTFMLLDKNGIILFRGVGKDALVRIESELEKKLNKND